MTPTINAPTSPTPVFSITDKAIALSLSLRILGNSRKVSSEQVQVEAEKGFINVTKKLLDSPELKAIESLDREAKARIMKYALPNPFLRSGIYLVPNKAVVTVNGIIKDFEEKRLDLIEKFMAMYRSRQQEAEKKLGALYNPMDYPSEGRVRNSFGLDTQFLNMGVPGKLKEISAEIFEEEQHKAAAKFEEATEEIRMLLRANLKSMVDHLVAVLTPGPDGKIKRFEKTTVTNLTEFLETFEMRNITDDSQLSALVKTAKELMQGVDIQTLKKNEAVQSNIQQSFTVVQNYLTSMVENCGARKIVLTDDAPEEEGDYNPFA